MTPEEMHARATFIAEDGDSGELTRELHLLTSQLWRMTAELCERLDALKPRDEADFYHRLSRISRGLAPCSLRASGQHRWGEWASPGYNLPQSLVRMDRCECGAKRPG